MLRTFPVAFVALVTNYQAGLAADAVNGKALFQQCSVCHGAQGVGTQRGPALKGVVGRKAGQDTIFRFSVAMRRSGITWAEATIARYLTDPQALVPGNRMPFSGVADVSAGADIAAYLATLKP